MHATRLPLSDPGKTEKSSGRTFANHALRATPARMNASSASGIPGRSENVGAAIAARVGAGLCYASQVVELPAAVAPYGPLVPP